MAFYQFPSTSISYDLYLSHFPLPIFQLVTTFYYLYGSTQLRVY